MKDTDTRNRVYVNTHIGEDWTNPRQRNITPTPKKVTAALVLLLILFLILVVITCVLLKYYLEIREEMSHLKSPECYPHRVDRYTRRNSHLIEDPDLAMGEEIPRLSNEKNICTPCPAGWSMIGCSCYFVSEETKTWDKAQDECFKNNSVLVMIKDKAELDIVTTFYKMNRRYWIGLKRDPEVAQNWKWLDGTQITFNNWGEGKPDNYLNREDCGETRPGSWNDRTCDDPTNYYICKK